MKEKHASENLRGSDALQQRLPGDLEQAPRHTRHGCDRERNAHREKERPEHDERCGPDHGSTEHHRDDAGAPHEGERCDGPEDGAGTVCGGQVSGARVSHPERSDGEHDETRTSKAPTMRKVAARTITTSLGALAFAKSPSSLVELTERPQSRASPRLGREKRDQVAQRCDEQRSDEDTHRPRCVDGAGRRDGKDQSGTGGREDEPDTENPSRDCVERHELFRRARDSG